MRNLSAPDLRRALQAVGDLHAVSTLGELPVSFSSVLQAVIPADHVGYNEGNTSLGRSIGYLTDPALQALYARHLELFLPLWGEHPILRHVERTGSLEAQRLSDHISTAGLHQLALYNEVYRPTGTERQLVIPIPLGGISASFALNRSGRDFSERDVDLARLLQPDLADAYQDCWRKTLLHSLATQRPEPALAAELVGLGLTAREAETLVAAVMGHTRESISQVLGISPLTAKTHLERAYAKLAASGRQGALRALVRHVDGRWTPPGRTPSIRATHRSG